MTDEQTKMSNYPPLVLALTHHHDAWIVGSAADPSNTTPRDIDVLVPLQNWQQASALIPKDAKVNSFGGWKCVVDEIEVDVWPGDLGWLMRSPKSKYALHLSTGVRLQRI